MSGSKQCYFCLEFAQPMAEFIILFIIYNSDCASLCTAVFVEQYELKHTSNLVSLDILGTIINCNNQM